MSNRIDMVKKSISNSHCLSKLFSYLHINVIYTKFKLLPIVFSYFLYFARNFNPISLT